MFVAIALYVVGFSIAAMPDDLRQNRHVILLQLIWIALCLLILSGVVAVFSRYDLPYLGSDRLVYEDSFAAAALGELPDFEPGFSLLTYAFAALTNSSVYFLFLFFVTTALYHILVAFMFKPKDWIVVYLFCLNYFVYFNATLNVIRQGLSAGLTCLAITYVMRRRQKMALFLILTATVFHSTAIFSLLIFLTRFSWLSVWRLSALILATFALSRVGVTELAFNLVLSATGYYPRHLLEYSSGLVSWRMYTGGVYRSDFLGFSLLPLVPYLLDQLKGRRSGYDVQFGRYEQVLRVYLTLLIPFAFFSYMLFSDRYLLQAWLLWPLLLCWPVLAAKKPRSIGVYVGKLAFAVMITTVPNLFDYTSHSTLLGLCKDIP